MSYFETVSVGDTRETAGRTVTEADVVNFAGVSGDYTYLHTDAEAMADSGFGERIAHGALVFAIMTGLRWQSRPPEERDAVVAFYGLDTLRFTAPTFIGDTIHVTERVAEKSESDHPEAAGTVTWETEVEKQDGTTVLYTEPVILLR
ncbi:MAG: MaoC/PaaZ C-terminal domain-containing protein [Halanaeroarchaeum sp.]